MTFVRFIGSCFFQLASNRIQAVRITPTLIIAALFLAANLSAQQWTEVTNGNTPPARHDHTLVSLNGVPYVFGGLGDPDSLDFFGDMWRWDGGWEEVIAGNASPAARRSHAAAEMDGKMYVWGGFGGTLFDDLWVYDPATNLWQEVDQAATRPPARIQHTAVSLQGKIWIYGGLGLDDLG